MSSSECQGAQPTAAECAERCSSPNIPTCSTPPCPTPPACSNDCSGNGKCDEDVGACVCDAKFYGPDCAEGCPPGADCECCPSAVFGMSPNATEAVCCGPAHGAARPTVDKDGMCCAGALDACGVCHGDGFAVDARGRCCTVRPSAPLQCTTDAYSTRQCRMLALCSHAVVHLPRYVVSVADSPGCHLSQQQIATAQSRAGGTRAG